MSRSQQLTQLIRRLRGKKKYLPFAKAMGVTRHTIQRWESGESDATLRDAGKKLAAYVNSSLEDLERYLDGEISIDTLLQDFDPTFEPTEEIKTLTVGRVLAWLPSLSLYELGLIGQAVGHLFANRTRYCGIQKLIEQELLKSNRPWSNATDRAERIAIFAEESILSVKELQQILDGECPTEDQLSFLARKLTHKDGTNWNIDELIQLVKHQQHLNGVH
jgi:transcriptional regulator with XRE-family HTH domain